MNYTIEHRSNERIRHVDSLSRVVEVNVIKENSMDQILSVEQGRDPIILNIRSTLKSTSDNSFSKFEMVDGLVYRKYDEKLLFYVPSIMESNVIDVNHNKMGHFGTKKGSWSIT